MTIYGRVSSVVQVGRDGLPRQLSSAREIAEEIGREVDEELTDEGFSGYFGEHVSKGDLGQYLRGLHALPLHSILIVENIDRLSRMKVTKAWGLMMRIIDAGVTVIVYSQRLMLNTATIDNNYFLAAMSLGEMDRAQKESARKQEFQRFNWNRKRQKVAAQDFSQPFIPYTRNCPDWLRWEEMDAKTGKGCFVIIPERVEIIRWMFRLLSTGVGRGKIASLMNQKRIKPWSPRNKSGMWHGGCVQKITDSRLVLGEFQMHTHAVNPKRPEDRRSALRPKVGEPLKGYYPQIISSELWRKARASSDSRRVSKIMNTGGQQGTLCSNLFRYRAHCGNCGHSMTRRDGRNREEPKFKCSGAVAKACDNTSLYPYAAIEERVLAWASTYAPAIDREDRTTGLVERLATLQEQRDLTKAKRRRLMAAFGDNDDDADALEAIGTLKSSIKALENEIEATEHKLDRARQIQAKHITLIHEMPGKLAEAKTVDDEFEIRTAVRVALHEVIEDIVFGRDGFTIKTVGNVLNVEFDRSAMILGTAIEVGSETSLDEVVGFKPDVVQIVKSGEEVADAKGPETVESRIKLAAQTAARQSTKRIRLRFKETATTTSRGKLKVQHKEASGPTLYDEISAKVAAISEGKV